MFTQLSKKGINVPNGFATTSQAFNLFLQENNLQDALNNTLSKLDKKSYSNLNDIGQEARELILKGAFSKKFSQAIIDAYKNLHNNNYFEVAVRGSATA